MFGVGFDRSCAPGSALGLLPARLGESLWDGSCQVCRYSLFHCKRERVHWSQLLSGKALPGMRGWLKSHKWPLKTGVVVKAREPQGSWSLPPPPLAGWWGLRAKHPHRSAQGAGGDSIVALPQPGRHRCSASSLFPPFHLSFRLPWPPACPPPSPPPQPASIQLENLKANPAK